MPFLSRQQGPQTKLQARSERVEHNLSRDDCEREINFDEAWPCA